jgi:hypothetical protein
MGLFRKMLDYHARHRAASRPKPLMMSGKFQQAPLFATNLPLMMSGFKGASGLCIAPNATMSRK